LPKHFDGLWIKGLINKEIIYKIKILYYSKNISMSFQRLTRINCAGTLLTIAIAGGSILPGFAYSQTVEEATVTPVKQNFYGKVVGSVVGTVSDSSSTLINNAMQLIGVRYRWGDSVQTGFDASAFVKYVLKDNLGFLFPVKTDDISKVGLQISRLKPGDLVFFNTLKRQNSHVGIYVGENKFIHAPARGSGVRVDDMTSVYWNMRFDGARRVDAKTQNEQAVLMTQ
jgi:cell wall-associated NlpC family hydrolase